MPDTPSFVSIKSPTLNGLNINIIIPETKLDRLLCNAKPIASPSAPIVVTNEDDGTPTTVNAIIRKTNIIVMYNT